MLAKTTDKNQRVRCELLPYVMLAYRTSVHESTGYTPYFLLFGHEATLAIDLQFPRLSNASGTNYHEYIAEILLRFHTAYKQARQYLQGQQRRQHELYDAELHGPETPMAKWFSTIIPHFPKDSVLKFNLFGVVFTKSHK